MTKQIEFEILGERRLLVFNNYARVEIVKHLQVDKGDELQPSAFLDRIKDAYGHNYLLLLKILVYAGHVGDCYRRQNHTDLTMEQVGEFVADADTMSLFDVFNIFLDSQGVNLPPDKTSSVGGGKKKTKPTGQKRSSLRSVK